MTDSQTSSATKLLQIIKKAYELDGTIATSEVWKQVLNFNPERDRTIEHRYLVMLQIFQHVKNELNEIARFGVNTEKFSVVTDKILVSLFCCPFNGQWQIVKNQISSNNLELLESFGEIVVSRDRGFRDISQEEVDLISSSITSLISEIDDSDIDATFKKNLIDKLERISRFLDDQQIFGATFFKKAVDEAFVETVIISQSIDKEKWSEEGLDKLKNVADFFFKLTTIYSSLEKTAPQLKHLAENIIQMLPSGN
jgi:hypothetical protein